jgi:DNA invertase Pin-like site-specific DNA recombinase
MLNNKLQELAKARAAVAQLEQEIQTNLQKELAGLPAQYGFTSVAKFAAAVTKATGSKPTKSATQPPATGKKRRKRAKITAETKDEVKKLAAAGKTGAEIATAVGISLPSVQNIKRELGLVRQHGKAPAVAATAAEAKPKAAAKPVALAKQKRRKRAVITDAIKAEVKKLVAAGKSGNEIAKAVKISLPSVHNVKKELGLLKKPDKAQAVAAPVAKAKAEAKKK